MNTLDLVFMPDPIQSLHVQLEPTSTIEAYLQQLTYTLVTDSPLENIEYIRSFPFEGPWIWLLIKDLEHVILNKWLKYTSYDNTGGRTVYMYLLQRQLDVFLSVN